MVIGNVSSLLHLDGLEPHQLVSLYHMSSLLHTMATHSPPLLSLLQQHFSEEFKYVRYTMCVDEWRAMLSRTNKLDNCVEPTILITKLY